MNEIEKIPTKRELKHGAGEEKRLMSLQNTTPQFPKYRVLPNLKKEG
jgi:hypothetical protein